MHSLLILSFWKKKKNEAHKTEDLRCLGPLTKSTMLNKTCRILYLQKLSVR